jgi:acetone carboxylase gamma subunit
VDAQFKLGEYLDVVAGEEGPRIRCAKCGYDLGPARGNYKEHTLLRRGRLEDAGPLVGDPKRFIDDEMELREYFCPGCVTLLDSEINRAAAPLLWDIELR